MAVLLTLKILFFYIKTVHSLLKFFGKQKSSGFAVW